MTVNQAYVEFGILVNRNLTNDNIVVDKARFILLFNRAQDLWFEKYYELKNNDSLRNIQSLLTTSKLSPKKENDYYLFELPTNYYDHSHVFFIGSKGSCKNQRIFGFEIKNFNAEEFLQDEFNKPSFFAREVPYYIGSNNIKVFTDFSLSEALLEYYRKPIQVEMENVLTYDDVLLKQNIHPEFSDNIVRQILTLASREFSLNNDERTVQIDVQRPLI